MDAAPEAEWAEEESAIERETKYLPEEVRKEVLDRDDYCCVRCGTQENLTVHHVRYLSLGGTHVVDNLITLCWWHHRAVHDKKLMVKLINGYWYFSGIK